MRHTDSLRLINLSLLCKEEGVLPEQELLVLDGKLQPIGSECPDEVQPRLVDCSGMFLCHGFVDLCAESGEPGYEDKEDLTSLGKAALLSGVTTVCVTPDTNPVNDARSVTEWIHRRARASSLIEVLPIAAATRNLDGRELADLYDIKESGVAGVQFGRGSVADSGLMRRAYEYAKGLGLLVFERPLDLGLHRGGLMHEGRWATEAGVKGSPSIAEDVSVSRAIALAHLVQSPMHIGPLSSSRSVEMVRRAKADGVPISASVNLLNLVYTSKVVRESLHPSLNVMPPLRDEDDRLALLRGLSDGTIDAISSGHSSQTSADKDRPFEWSTPGACTLPILVPTLLERVRKGEMEQGTLIRALSYGGNSILGRSLPSLRSQIGQDLVIVDPNFDWSLSEVSIGSKGRNVPCFDGGLKGRVFATFLKGQCFLKGQG